ncbi:hypothetical protein CB0940_11157 [Cercospora beticola]|uniref:Uncharacterized protein n=1 Tax=Cercospora beticola TaxID=122368 RepID=A0A2G5HCQ5_CERBT|nr:hypothetical protein CB0940_11157 [Cercospora beticola]PIA90327.1 hypothetical protein CB0940_11157 [Cercospora beticola]WPB07987.1 hypothetical protein RHO25_012651 [Cercospora beticola]
MQLIYSTLVLALLNIVVHANPAPAALVQNVRRQEAPMTMATGVTSSAITTASESQVTDVYTGVFTAGANGVYGITSQSGYVQIAGYSLTAEGAGALVGGLRVSVASQGEVVVGGTTVPLEQYTPSSSTSEQTRTTQPTTTSETASEFEMTESAAATSSGAADTVGVGFAGVAILGGLGALFL